MNSDVLQSDMARRLPSLVGEAELRFGKQPLHEDSLLVTLH